VGNGDGAADDQSYVEGVDDFVAVPAFLAATNEMIGDAIVATQDGGSDQAEEFLCFCAESAGLIGLMIESEEALHAEVAAVENFFIQIGPKFLKIFEAVRHDSSRREANIMDQIGFVRQDAGWVRAKRGGSTLAFELIRDCRERFLR
jgi:hypothetical protein